MVHCIFASSRVCKTSFQKGSELCPQIVWSYMLCTSLFIYVCIFPNFRGAATHQREGIEHLFGCGGVCGRVNFEPKFAFLNKVCKVFSSARERFLFGSFEIPFISVYCSNSCCDNSLKLGFC